MTPDRFFFVAVTSCGDESMSSKFGGETPMTSETALSASLSVSMLPVEELSLMCTKVIGWWGGLEKRNTTLLPLLLIKRNK